MVDTNKILAQSALDQALHATGLSELQMPALAFLNMVGQHITSMHSWSWLTEAQARMAVHANLTITNGNWTESTRQLLAASGTPFTGYVFVEGHQFEITGGTGVFTNRWIDVESAGDASTRILLKESLAVDGLALNNSDIAGTLHANTVEFPSDFGSIIGVSASDTLVNGLTLVTPTALMALRTNQIEVGSTWSYRCTVIYPGSPSRPVLDIYPDFTTSKEGHFSIFYKRGWGRLSTLSDTIRIPDYAIPLYFQLVRAWALGLSDEDVATVDMRLNVIQHGPVFKAAKNMDWRVQPHFGKMTGGMVARVGRKSGPNALSTEVAGPS